VGAPEGEELLEAVAALRSFADEGKLTSRISDLERRLVGCIRADTVVELDEQAVSADLLNAAFVVKRASAQIHVTVHALGVLVSLPYILQPDERIESLSLGAGNTGRRHDLETTLQVAEFKFIDWQGGSETIRQNSLFIDFFNLVTAEKSKRKVLYVLDKENPLRFLSNRRALTSVLSKNRAVSDRFFALYGKAFMTVAEFYETVSDQVEIVDLGDLVPALSTLRQGSQPPV
jgi:hypothetical protein